MTALRRRAYNSTTPTDEKMSGLAGFIGRNGAFAPGSTIGEMLGSMSRYTLSSPGAVSFPDLGLELGWLSTRGPLNDCVPVWNERKDVFLLFRGEHFLADDPLEVSGNGQPAANFGVAHLLRQYEQLGADLFAKLNGRFSGVLADLRRNIVVLFNDRYGLGRIYYHQAPNGFYFSSEAKALLKIFPSLRQLDTRSLGEFLSCDCVLQDRTIFRDVFILPTASAWTFGSNGILEKRRYFHPRTWEEQRPLSSEDYRESLRDIFPKILKRYLRHPVGVGMSLTGGLDGRLVMAWSALEPRSMPCYSFGSSFGQTADVRIAREIASVCTQPFTELRVGEEFLSQFPDLARETVLISDGAMDVSGAAELYVNRLARQIKPVRLTGNYGSEILRGNIAFRPRGIVESLFDDHVVKAIQQAEKTYAEESRENRRSFIAFKQVPWYHFSRFAVEKSQLAVRSPYLDNELVKLAFQAPKSDQANFDICLRLAAEGNPKLAGIPTDRGVRYGANTFLNRWHQTIEEFWRRVEYAYDYGMPNWLARADGLLSPLRLEAHFLGRQKFCHFRTWYRRELSGFVRDILLDAETLSRPFLNRRRVEQIVTSHIKGTANFTLAIHKLLSCELVHRTLIDQN
jgi:asparagine synthase (glutamine-hydrolysing)